MAAKKKEIAPEDKNPLKNKASVERWLSRITQAVARRTKQAEQDGWKRILEEFKGNFQIANNSADIQINPLNFVFAYVKTEIPALYIRDPYLKVNPKKATSIEAAQILEQAINYLWRYKKLKRENKKNVQDGKLIGHSWFKVGYTGKFGTVEDKNGNPSVTIESEDFFGYRIPWDSIVFDKKAVDAPNDCDWIAHAVWINIEDAKKNPRYKNSEQLAPMSRKSVTSNSTSDDEEDEISEDSQTRVWEVWDRKNMRVFTVADGMSDYLEAPKPWPYQMRGYPFSFLNFNPVNDEGYGISDVHMFETQVLELTKVRAMQLDHIKRYNRQLITKPGNLTQEQKDNLMLGITANVIEASEPEKLFPIPYPPLQTDIYAVESAIKEDMINISGQSPQERGATQKTTTRTFRELAQIARGAENRRAEQIDVVQDFVADIATNLVCLLQQFADVPYFVRTTDKLPEEIIQAIKGRPSQKIPGSYTVDDGFTFTKEDIKGEFDIEVVPGSTAPLDKANTMQTVLSMLELFPQLGVMPGGPIAAAVGTMVTEQLQIPQLQMAMKEEAKLQQQMKEESQAQQDKATQLQIAQQASKTQIDAEKVADKQNQTLLKAVQAFKPPSLAEVK